MQKNSLLIFFALPRRKQYYPNMNVRINPIVEGISKLGNDIRRGRRSRPTMLNLAMRRPVGAEPEVGEPSVQTASERSNNCLPTKKFDLSEAVSLGGMPCPQVRLRLTRGYLKLDGYAAHGVYHSLILPPPHNVLTFCGHSHFPNVHTTNLQATTLPTKKRQPQGKCPRLATKPKKQT